jgi:predicted transcriptional regulator
MTSNDEVGKTVKSLFRVLSLDEKKIDYQKVQPWVLAPGQKALHELKVGPFRFDAEKFVTLAEPHSLTRRMTTGEKKVMKESISQNGVQTAVFVDSTGRIIDGFHRVLSSAEVLIEEGRSVSIPFKTVQFSTLDNEAEFVVLSHMVRRQFTLNDKRNMVKELLLMGHDGTAGFIADMVNLTTNTVKVILEDLTSSGQIHHLEKRRDARGSYHSQPYPAKKITQSVSTAMDKENVTDEQQPLKTDDNELSASNAMGVEAVDTVESPGTSAVDSENDMQPEDLGIDHSNSEGSEVIEPKAAPAEDEIQNQSNDSELDQLLYLAWEMFGPEPFTTVEMLNAVNKCTRGKPLPASKAELTKIGKILTQMVQLTDDVYLVRSKQVGGRSIYYMRIRAWTDHGPE